MYFIINIFFIFCFILFSKFIFRSNDNFSYNKIIKIYLLFFIALIVLSIHFNYLILNQSFNYLCLIMNMMIFISYLLTIGIKFVDSPSYYIINFLKKNNPCEKQKLLEFLKNQKIIEERINILQKEKLLVSKNNLLSITKNGRVFCIVFLFIKNFLGLKSEG